MYTTREVPASDRSRSGLSDYRTSKTSAPGISSRLLPELLSEIVYIDILDVAAYMPPLLEYPEVVSLVDDELIARVAEASEGHTAATTALKQAQATNEVEAITAAEEQLRMRPTALAERRRWASERNLAAAYQEMTNTLTERAKKGSSTCRMMSDVLPRWFVAHPFNPPFQIWTTRKGRWSEELGCVLEYQAPTLSPDHRYPLERRCVTIVGAESSAGRSVMVVYYEQSEEVRIFYLAYAGTVSHDKLKQLASQGGAAAIFSGNAPQGGLAEPVGADQGALAQIAQKLAAGTDLSAAFARRHHELASAIAAGRDWLGIEHASLPDRMAFMRAATPRPLWLPPPVPTSLPTTAALATTSQCSLAGLN